MPATQTFPAIESNKIGSPAMMIRVFQLYHTFAEVLESDDFKNLQAGVRHIETRNTPAASEEDEAEAKNVEDDSSDDGEYYGYSAVKKSTKKAAPPPPAIYPVVCDYREQLDHVQELEKPDFDKLMRQADLALGKHYRKAMAQFKEAIPDCDMVDGDPFPFAERLAHQVKSGISQRAILEVLGPIMLQLDTSESSVDEITLQAVSWAIGRLYEDEKYTFNDAVDYLSENYLHDDVYDNLKEKLEEMGLGQDLPELHDDLRTGDLTVAGTDVLTLHFWDDENSRNELGIAKQWAVNSCEKVHSKLWHGSKSSGCRWFSDEDTERAEILNSAVTGRFMLEVKTAFTQAVIDNIKELVYNCWAKMLLDLIQVVTQEVSETRTKVLSEVACRAVNRSRPDRQGDTQHEEVSEMSEA